MEILNKEFDLPVYVRNVFKRLFPMNSYAVPATNDLSTFKTLIFATENLQNDQPLTYAQCGALFNRYNILYAGREDSVKNLAQSCGLTSAEYITTRISVCDLVKQWQEDVSAAKAVLEPKLDEDGRTKID